MQMPQSYRFVRYPAGEVMRLGNPMQIMLSALAAATILGAANLAYAAEATGTIKSIDMSKHTVTLDN